MAEGTLTDLQALIHTLAEAAIRTESHLQTLAAAQARTEARLDALTARVEELAAAQVRTEARLDALTARVEELAVAQARTEARLDALAARVDTLTRHMDDLAQAQRRTSEEMAQLRRTLDIRLGGLGARWGMQTEEAFRQGMAGILVEVGFQAERYLAYDTAGEVFGRPDQIELDVVVRNGKVIIMEIKSSLDRGQVHHFTRKVDFYQQQTGREVARRIIITPFVEPRARDLADSLGVEVYTDVAELR